jgi:hypothetical protein
MLGELIPVEWVGKYVSLELGANEPVRLTARLDKVIDSGIVTLVKVAVSGPDSRGRWGAPSYNTRFVARCYPSHSIHSIRLLVSEEREALEGWPPEMGEVT